MPFLLAKILNFQGSTHHIGVGSFSYKFAVENIPENELNVRALLAQTMKRVR